MLKVIKKKGYFKITDDENKVLILTKKYKLGSNIFIGENTKIINHDGGPMETLFIGDNVQIHHDSTIMVPSFSVLDYTKINNYFYAYGINNLCIGYNCWFGGMVVVDTLGGMVIKNNVCVASHSQIYSHAKYGDTLFGCRINSVKKVILSDDVWISPNCTVIMASMAQKSMLLAGCVLTKNTFKNHIYAGVPAIDIVNKTGPQFKETTNSKDILFKLKKYLTEFYDMNPNIKKNCLKICLIKPDKLKKNISYFVVSDRKYTKKLSKTEVAFMKFLLPDKGKFIPY